MFKKIMSGYNCKEKPVSIFWLIFSGIIPYFLTFKFSGRSFKKLEWNEMNIFWRILWIIPIRNTVAERLLSLPFIGYALAISVWVRLQRPMQI